MSSLSSYVGSVSGCKDIFCSFRRYQVNKLVENCWQGFGQRMKEAAPRFLCYKLSVVMWCMGGGAELKLSDPECLGPPHG